MVHAAVLAAFALPLGGLGDYQPGAFHRVGAAPQDAAVVSAAAATRTFGGHTNQAEPLVFRTRGKRLTTVVLQLDPACDAGGDFPVQTSLGAGKSGAPTIQGGHLSRTGKFKASSAGIRDLGDEVATANFAFAGKLGSKRSKGGVVVDVVVTNKATGQQVDHCAVSENWTHDVPERRVFGGATNQDGPILLDLSRNRKKVSTFWFGLFAPCTPDGVITPVDGITNFPISKHRFGDTFSDEGSDGAGGRIHVDYALAGKIGRSSASGTFQITATDRDAQGNVISNCPSGRLHWKAQQ